MYDPYDELDGEDGYDEEENMNGEPGFYDD